MIPSHLEKDLLRLIQKHGRLTIDYQAHDGVGYIYIAELGFKRGLFGAGGSIPTALEVLVSEHLRLEREALQNRIAEIDGSSHL